MSGDYASRLKEYHHKGVCGLPETCDSKRTLQTKVSLLADMLQKAQTVVVLTGAGISTAAGIPDFRGPKGVWTLEQKQKRAQTMAAKKKKKNSKTPNHCKRQRTTETVTSDNMGTSSITPKTKKNHPSQTSIHSSTTESSPSSTTTTAMDFCQAQPTLTHRALYYLWKHNVLQFLITQNVDGLHRRSGFSRNSLAVLHGCVFTEKCESCGQEYFRDTEVPGISFQRTGNRCTVCSGHLRDTLLDWCDHLPQDDWDRCNTICEKADIILTLGTSLRMEPCAGLVHLAKQYVIVNLQETPYDKDAALVIRYKVDQFMPLLLTELGFPKDWESTFPHPEIQRVSESLCPNYSSEWWKIPPEEDEKDNDE
jgi:mono-ADP-ribosyltransferase sirtuin 6